MTFQQHSLRAHVQSRVLVLERHHPYLCTLQPAPPLGTLAMANECSDQFQQQALWTRLDWEEQERHHGIGDELVFPDGVDKLIDL